MRIRELKKVVGQTSISAWPPTWAGSIQPGDKLPFGVVGVLKDIARRPDYLSLTMEYESRTYTGTLSWSPPPPLEAVEDVLRSNIGRELREIGEVEVQV